MDVDDHISHLGIVNRALRLCAPGINRCIIGTVDADNMHALGILEFNPLRIFDAATHDEVETLGGGGFCHVIKPLERKDARPHSGSCDAGKPAGQGAALAFGLPRQIAHHAERGIAGLAGQSAGALGR